MLQVSMNYGFCVFCQQPTSVTADRAYCKTCDWTAMPVREEVEQLSPHEAVEELHNQNTIMLDVRRDDELAIAKISDTVHIEMKDIPRRYSELPQKTIICQCRSGGRSQHVARFLLQHGFVAKNLAGGINLWAETVDTSLEKY
jgi:phage shock protein E